jgi:flagellar FliJ protein
MTRSQRLNPVIQAACAQEEQAAHALRTSRAALQEREHRLEELLRYQAEYARRFGMSGGLDGARLRDFHQFLARLNSSIGEQQRLVERARAEHARVETRWRERHSKSQALDKVAGRLRAEEAHEHARREQNELDERTQRRPLR